MQTSLMWLAAAASFFTFAGHIFIGGPQVVKPLLAATDLSVEPKWTNYFCWHVTTLLVLAMSIGFTYVALHPNRPELAIFLSSLSAAIWALSVIVAVKGRISPFRFPAIWLFAIIAALGAAALMT